jgi:lysyl-tRNA synthetase class 2
VILAPSDLLRGRQDRDSVLVGGRARLAGGRLTLRDAFGEVPTDLAAGDVAEGDLAVVLGAFAATTACLTGARVVERHRPSAPRADGDVRRFLDRGLGARLEARANALGAVRAYFEEQRFVEVETPCLVPSPGLDVHLVAFEIEDPQGAARFLSTSPEYQMKRLLVGGVPRCFQIARAFRRDEAGRHHNAEFTLLEWYRAFAGSADVIRDTEALIARVLDTINPRGEHGLDLALPFPIITVAQAFHDYASISEVEMLRLASEDREAFFRALVDRVEPTLAAMRRPVILSRYPAVMASLARLCPDDPRYADRFEAYAGGMELSNGFGELVDPVEQRRRFERDRAERANARLAVPPVDERFVAALGEGMPPSAGNALGLDRLVALGLGAAAIGDAMAFPAEEL